MSYSDVILAAVGVILLIAPEILIGPKRRAREARLAELRAGAPETYFEERRALEAYPLTHRKWVWRLLGAVTLLLFSSRFF